MRHGSSWQEDAINYRRFFALLRMTRVRWKFLARGFHQLSSAEWERSPMGLDSASAHIFVYGNPCLSSCRTPGRREHPHRLVDSRLARTTLAPTRLANDAHASTASQSGKSQGEAPPPPIIIGGGHQDGASAPPPIIHTPVPTGLFFINRFIIYEIPRT